VKKKNNWAIEPKNKKGAKFKNEGVKKKLGYYQPTKTRIKRPQKENTHT